MDREKTLLAYLISNPQKRELVKGEYFDSTEHQEIFNFIFQHYEKNDSEPISLKELNFSTEGKYRNTLKRIKKYMKSLPEENYILKFIASKMVKEVILEEIPKFVSLEMDLEKLKLKIQEAQDLCISSSSKKIEGINLLDFKYEDVDFMAEDKKVPTPLKRVYIYPGELGAWAGVPKKGKTLALVNSGVVGLVHGLRVYHWSLEITRVEVFQRYCSRILGRKAETRQDIEKAKSLVRRFGGQLIVKDEPYASTHQIREWVRKGKPDLLIVDYADLVVAPKKRNERRFEIRDVLLEFRNIAKENYIPVWTASQGTAKSEGKKNITLADLEEAKIIKAGICSLLIFLNQNEDEDESNLIQAFILASTRPFQKRKRLLDIDRAAQLIRDTSFQDTKL